MNDIKVIALFFRKSHVTKVSDMLAEHGMSVHRSTNYRWFIEYAPILRKNSKNINLFELSLLGSSWGAFDADGISAGHECYAHNVGVSAISSTSATLTFSEI
ncbi:hypothetical protein ACKE44_002892 [Providencia stuartii]